MYSTLGKNKMLDALGATHVSLHSALPSDIGSNELAGGVYARQSITFSAAAAGNLDSSNIPSFNLNAATTVAYVGYWDALTAGNYLGHSTFASETFANAGTLTLTDADLDLNL